MYTRQRCLFITLFLLFSSNVVNANELCIEVDTIFSLEFTNDENCKSCLSVAPEYPHDFVVDKNKNVYILEFQKKSIKKYDSTGTLIWNCLTKENQYLKLHILGNLIYLTEGTNLLIINKSNGRIVNCYSFNTVKDSLFPGDFIYFYKNILYIKYLCTSTDYAFAITTLLYDIKSNKLIEKISCGDYGYTNSKDKSSFWPVPDCPDCIEHLNKFKANALVGQSERFVVLSITEPEPKITGKYVRILVFDKKIKELFKTNLAQYDSEPYNSGQFKFVSSNQTVIQATDYIGGMPGKVHYLLITLNIDQN